MMLRFLFPRMAAWAGTNVLKPPQVGWPALCRPSDGAADVSGGQW